MGKRARKTRWRALDIADEHSDSEESNTNSSAVSSRTSRSYSNGIYSKNSYSSQSTPARRRYNQYDGSAKSTRSSSTTSENKITFNEDEYTRITTPRQDVLFKKGYLNKPKSYQTQTSTGNSTISTGNSTENGTPDHQSTDLDYESQFMFPNGFVDQNGIYYVNSYEPYPLMLFNPPTYYHECSNIKSKRMSIGSLSESMSPNNEESTSQDLSPSGGDASNSVSDYSGGPPVYNMVFPSYYVDGSCTPTDLANGHHFPHEPVKKFKKRRERQTSKNIQENSSENTDENSSDENSESNPPHEASSVMTSPVHQADPVSRLKAPGPELLQTSQDCSHNEAQISEPKEELKTVCENSNPSDNTLSDGCADIKTESIDENAHFNQAQPNSNHSKSSVLKPDAEEFVPRSYINIGPPPHIKMLPTNFMPIPLVPINDFGGQNFAPHPAFIPPGIPVNFIPHPGQKLFPPGPGFVNFAPPMIHETKIEEIADKTEENEEKENQSTATPSHTPALEESKPIVHSKAIDIATVVSKLEAVKQQENVSQEEDSTVVLNETKPFIGSPRFKNPSGKRDYYNKYRGTSIHSGEASPQIKNGPSSPQFYDASNHVTNYPICNGNDSPKKQINGESLSSVQNGQTGPLKYRNSPVRQVGAPSPVQSNSIIHRNSPVRHIELAQQLQNGNVTEKLFDNAINQYNKAPTANSAYLSKIDSSKQIRNSPERLNRNWKYNRNQNSYENHHQNSYARSRRVVGQQNNQNYSKPPVNGFQKSYVNGELSPNEHYSETLRKAHIISVTSSPQSKKHINVDNPEKTVEKVADVSKSQWISVSNRKKKKNKNMEDSDLDNDPDFSIEPAKPENTSSDFESYDVSQLVDVVPVTPSAEKENNIEDILSIIAQNEAPEVLANGQQTPPDIKIPEVSDIEKDIIVKIEEQRESSPEKIPKEDLHTVLISKIEENKNEVAHASEMLPVKEDRAEKEEETFRTKKRSKKGTQKPLTKKVIITDIDLSMTVTEVKTPVKKIATKVEEVDSIKTQPQVPVVIVSEESTTVKETTQQVSLEQTEKKSKKRKKNKTPKSNQNDSLSESNVISNTSDDSIEFRTENSLLTESIDRTNDDVSLELEKLIQRGMYSSLQEKIKSIHVEPEADGFFKNFQAVPSSGMEKATTPHGFMKTPDFNRIFQSTRQFIKPNSVSLKNHNSDNKVEVDDSDYKDTKTSSSAPDSADARSGLFLVNAKEVQEVQEIQEAPTDATIEPKSPATENEDHEDSKKLYPITQAVKEWMSKTREATPEVEILKSPTTIQKEFGDNGNPDDLNDPSDLDEDDEVTLFSTNDTLGQEHPDLLEYWEDDITNNSITASKCCEKLEDGNHPKLYSKGTCCTKCQNDSIKEGEEELEIYESKYGKNYLFPKLQRELKEKESRPKSLPHRTICCSLQ